MNGLQPRVQVPRTVDKGEIFEVRTFITHPMETGLRQDKSGAPIPRQIIHTFTCYHNDTLVFSADLREAMAANPFLSFTLRAQESGVLRFVWEEDGGGTSRLESPLTVRA